MKNINRYFSNLWKYFLPILFPAVLFGAGASISISDGSITETESDTMMEFTVSFSGTSAPSDISFNYVTAPDTASAWNGTSGDYEHKNASAYIPSGQKSVIIQIPIKGDFEVEGSEQFKVNITSGTTVLDGEGIGTITDNDSGRNLTLTGAPVVSENGAYATLTVNTSKTATAPIPFSYSTVTTGSADSSDFTPAVSISGSIPTGLGSTTFTIPILNDTVRESQETFDVTINSGKVNVSDNNETVTINDDDLYSVSASPSTLSTYEGNSSNTPQAITLTISQIPLSGDSVTVNYSINHGTTNSADFNTTSGSVQFTSSDTLLSKTLKLGIVGDTTAEPDETYSVTLSISSNGNISPTLINGTILNDDSRLISIGTPTAINETNSGTTTLSFPVNLISTTTSPVTVYFYTTDGSATTADNDYVGVSNTIPVTIAAGSLTGYANITINGDTKYEGNEDFDVTLANPSSNATIDVNNETAKGTINNDDNKPIISITSPSAILEQDSGTQLLYFRITQNVVSGLNSQFKYDTANGTATASEDYVGVNHTVTANIPAGSLYTDINITINGDTKYESNETFTVTLRDNVNVDLNNSSKVATGTIQNNDAMPVISIDSNSTQEGNSGTKTLPFRIYLDQISGVSTTVKYSTADGTGTDKATQPSDYTQVSNQTITIPAGSLSANAQVTIQGDLTQESDEIFSVTLSGENNATLNATKTVATGTIINDDNLTLRIYPASGADETNTTEGNSGTQYGDFNITLSGVPVANVSVTYAVGSPNTANAIDFGGSFPTNTVTFTASTTTLTQTVHIPIAGDYSIEPHENYTVTLSAPTNATIASGKGSAIGNIINDDTNITIVPTASVQEGPCNTVYVDLNVSLGQIVNYPITVNYTTSLGSVNPATPGTDYGSSGGSITINANTRYQLISIPIYHDTDADNGETFKVVITNPAGIAIINDTATVTITDNQERNVTGFEGNSVYEGDSGTPNSLAYTITLCNPLGNPITINYTKSGTATPLPSTEADYNSTSTSFTFPANQLSHTFYLPVYGDLRTEGDETVILTLQPTAGINLTDSVATGIIIDDDNRTISINDTNVTEGNPVSTTAASLRISMSAAAGAPVTVYYSTQNGTATTTAPSDYTSASGSVTFNPGDPLFKDIVFSVTPDFNVENNETFDVNISTSSGVTITDNRGTITIIDDDNRTLTLGGIVSYTEGSVDRDINLTVTLVASDTPRSLTYTTAPATAVAGSDYVHVAAQTIPIPSGATSVNLPITLKGDLLYEPLNETFTVSIVSLDGFAVSNSPLTITIVDDDGNLSIDNPPAIMEGDNNDTNITFTVTLSRDMNTTVNVSYASSDYGATQPADYSQVSGTLTFAPHEMSKPINVIVHGDTEYEPFAQLLKMTLNAPGLTLTDNGNGLGIGVGTINDDDARNVTVSSPSYNETETNTTRKFTIQLDAPMIEDLNITYHTVNGSAIADIDYVAIPATNITIPANTNAIIEVPVTVIGNYLSEPNKDFNLSVSTARPGVTFSGGKFTILNDDGALSINPVALYEYESNISQTKVFSYTIDLNRSMDSNVSVNFWTTDGNATSLGVNKDFNASSGVVIFEPGQITKPVNITVLGDIMIEGTEFFDLNISNSQGVYISNSNAKGYILDDDGRKITIDSKIVDENDSGSHITYLTVSLDAPSGNSVTIHYDINSTQATDGIDYNKTSGDVTILAGDSNATIPIIHYGDVTFEPNEVINVGISTSAMGFSIPVPLGTVTLRNDDGQIAIMDLVIAEGDTIIPNADVNVTWSDSYEVDINVSYTTHDGSALISDNDYLSANGSFIIPRNSLPSTHPISIPVTINPDYYSEPNETFHVILSSAQAVTFSDKNATVTILNDDNDSAGVYDTHYRDFDVRFRKNLYGDFASTGAPVMCVVDSSGNCNWDYAGNLLDANTSFIDEVPSMDGNNSSSAVLTLPIVSGDKILWAGLYWQGHIHGTNPADITSAIQDYNKVVFRTPDGIDHNVTADITSGSDEIGYYNFRTSVSSSYPGYRMFYQGFRDVTVEVNTSLQTHFADRTFSVSGIKSTAGKDTYIGDPEASWGGWAYGNFAGWSLVVVYEKNDKSNPDDLRNVTISDGYKFLIAPPGGSRTMDINITGFKTPKTGDVDSKMLFFGGLGERNILGDTMKISDKNDTFHEIIASGNPFNDTISLLGSDINRNYNPGIDLDTIDVSTRISNDQNKTTIRLGVVYQNSENVTDQIFAGLVGFSTQLYQPQLCYDYTYKQNGSYIKSSDFNTSNVYQKPLLTGVVGTNPVEAGIYLKNVESDFPIEGLSIFSDMNGTRIQYIAGTSGITSVNGTIFQSVSESSACVDYENGTATDIACRFPTDDDANKKNVRIGLGREVQGYSKNKAGYLSSGDYVFTRFNLDPFANLNSSEDLKLKLNYFINLGDGEIPYEYTLGQNVKLCPPSGTYAPTLGQFNVVDSANVNANGTALINNLYTQVAKKPFNTDVAFYESNGGLYNIPPSTDVNTTVLVEIIDADAYHDINASCANPSAAVSSYELFVSLQANTPDNTTPIQTQNSDYYNFAIKNAAFRVWWFDEGSGILIQNWKAYNSSGNENNVTGNNLGSIAGLFNTSQHSDCNASCIGRETTVGPGSCFECMKQRYMHPICSRDNFSMRPESFDLRIYDQNQTTAVKLQALSELSGHIPTSSSSNELNLSAGYQYSFEINATNHTSDLHSTPGYTRYFSGANSDYNATMYWDSTKTLTECNNVDDVNLTFNVINGFMSDSNQSHAQIGEYLLNIIDQGWTAVDWRDLSHHTASAGFDLTSDCTINSTNTNMIGNNMGCLISSNHTNGSLTYRNHDLQFKPYKFDLSSMVYTRGKNNTILPGGSGFIYDSNLSQDSDLNMSLRSTTQIKAVGFDGTVVTNYVRDCYAKDLNITIGHNANLALHTPYTSRLNVIDVNGTQVFDTNKTIMTSNTIFGIDDSNFSRNGAGVVSTQIRLNFDRNISRPLDPQLVQYSDFNISCAALDSCSISADGLYNSKVIRGESAMDFNITHVYGRVIPRDVRVFGNGAFTSTAWYEVYNTPSLLNIQMTPSKNATQWYTNKLHNDTNDGDANITMIVTSTNTPLPITSISNLTGIENYMFNGQTPPYNAKAHMEIDSWLWHQEKAAAYSDPSLLNQDCFTHPCFNIFVVPAVGASGSARQDLEKTNKASTQQGGGWHSTTDYAPAIQ